MGKKNCCIHGTPFNQKVKRYSGYKCSCCESEYEHRDKNGLCPGCRGDLKTQSAIKKTGEKLRNKIEKLYADLSDLQKTCNHPRATKRAGSNTGNWCKSDDCYYYDCECPDCGYRWTEDQ